MPHWARSLRRLAKTFIVASWALAFGGAPAAAGPYHPHAVPSDIYGIQVDRTRNWARPLWVGTHTTELGVRVGLLDFRRIWRLQLATLQQPAGLAGTVYVRTYRIVDSWRPHRCLDIKGPATGNRTPVHEWNCKILGFRTDSPHASQAWKVTLNDLGQSQLINAYSGKCLDVTDFRAVKDQLLQVYSCSEAWNQAFRLVRLG